MNHAIEILENTKRTNESYVETYQWILEHSRNGLDVEQIRDIKRDLLVAEKRIEDIKIALEMLHALRHNERGFKHLKSV